MLVLSASLNYYLFNIGNELIETLCYTIKNAPEKYPKGRCKGNFKQSL